MPETRNVTIAVQTLGIVQTNTDGSRQVKITYLCDDLNMKQYPSTLFVPTDAGLQAGTEYWVTLAKGKIKQSRDADGNSREKDPQYDTNWFWNWVSMADPDAQPQQQAQLPNATEVYVEHTYEPDPWDTPTPPKPKPAWNGRGCPPGRDSVNYSIEMQVVFKEVCADLRSMVGEDIMELDALFADYRRAWLRVAHGIEVPAEEPDPSSP
jgi:hypothetical protein